MAWGKVFRSLETLWQDLRYGVRMLAKSPGFTVVAVLSLALGIGAATAFFSVISAVLLRPLGFNEPERLVKIYEGGEPWMKNRFAVAPATFLDWRRQNAVFEDIGAYRTLNPILTGAGQPRRVRAVIASASIFPLLGVTAAQGRTFLPEEDTPEGALVVVLGHALSRQLFGLEANPLGRTVILDGKHHTIIGVLPSSFRFYASPHDPEDAGLWLTYPFRFDPPSGREIHRHSVLGRLRPGVTLRQAQAEMDRIAKGLEQTYAESKGWRAYVYPFHEDLVHLVQPSLEVLLGAAGFLLLIACANVASLLLTRASVRQREMAIRTALGAGRSRLVRQLLTESLLLFVMGAGLGVLLARWALGPLASLIPVRMPRLDEIGMDARVLGIALLTSLLIGIIFGLAPAVQGSKPRLNEPLKGAGRTVIGGFGRRRRHSVLIAAQIALSQVLLIGAGLMINSFARRQSIEMGFNPRNVLAMQLSLPRTKYAEDRGLGSGGPAKGVKVWEVGPRQTAFVYNVLERIQAFPGVVSAGTINYLPLGPFAWGVDFDIDGRQAPDPKDPPYASFRPVTAGYFRTLDIPLSRGRFFSEQDRQSHPGIAIINLSLARTYWPNEDPIGKRVFLRDGLLDERRSFEIVGVVGNTRQDLILDGIRAGTGGVLYVPYFQQARAYVDSQIGFRMHVSFVVRTTSRPELAAAALRSIVNEVDHDQPIGSIPSMEQFIADTDAEYFTVRPMRFYMVLLGIFAAVALTVAAIGVYGVVNYSVAQRTHEIGVRMALGAQRSDVLKLILRQGLAVALIGGVVGVGGACWLTQLIASQLHDVSRTDPVTFAAATLFLLAVALLATYLPARRASKVDPTVALRYE